MRYLLYPRSSTIKPVLSHFFAILPAPCWFWRITFMPGFSGLRSLAWVDHLSAPFKNRFLNAISLVSRQSTQISAGENCPGLIGRKSRIGLPKINWLGDSPYSASGVFRCCIIALMILSQCGEPSVFVLSNNNRLPLFTAVSARRLLDGTRRWLCAW